jgi:AcrR family transcriptional regulator
MAPASASTAASTAKTGLRERKKIQTRQAIRRAAYRLFEEQGYDGTTVEQIASSAEVSPSTVFRYFPTKEDIVLTDEYDPFIEAAVRSRPAGEPFVETLRQAVLGTIQEVYTVDQEELVQRMRLSRGVPAIRARMGENTQATCDRMCAAIAEREGRPVDDFEIRVVVGAVVGAWSTALMAWVDQGGVPDLGDLIDHTLQILRTNLA